MFLKFRLNLHYQQFRLYLMYHLSHHYLLYHPFQKFHYYHLSQQFQQSLNMDPRQNLASQFLPSSIHQRSSGHTPNVIRNDSSSGEDVSHSEQMRREASRG